MKREDLFSPDDTVADAIARWAEEHRRIRRVWVVREGAQRTLGAGEAIDLAIEVDPIGDSEETLVVGLANEGAWRRELRTVLARNVGLEWVDTDGIHTAQAVRDEAKRLVYDRSMP